jgi:hypothetical protein
MDIPQQFLDEIIEEAKADEVGLWFIIFGVRDDLGVKQPALVKAITLQVVNQILNSGTVVAGYYKPHGAGMDVLNMAPEKVVSRIEEEWNQLGREPNIGESVVFVGKSARAKRPAVSPANNERFPGNIQLSQENPSV